MRTLIRQWKSGLGLAGCALISMAALVWSMSAQGATSTRSNTVLAEAAADSARRFWDTLPATLARIVPPVFPEADFDITQFGARGDGVTDCTPALRKAIEVCSQAGGGRVIVPAGTFLTGAIHLKSNVNLHIASGGILRFSTEPKSYLPVVFTRYECTEVMNYSPFVYALEQENIAISGEGTLDGQASMGVWYRWKTNSDAKLLVDMGTRGVAVRQRVFGEGHQLRPNFVEPVRCRNVLIEGVHLTNSPMWVLHPLYCTNVTIRGVTVSTSGPNTDGCDPDSCSDVLIKDCSFSDGDDCIAVKSGRDRDGRRVNIPCQNIVIQNCVFRKGHGGVTLGSETAGGIRSIFAQGCRFDSPDLDAAMRFKTNPARGGFIENIYLRNCSVETAKFGIHMTLRYSSSGASAGDSIPICRNIDIRDCTFRNLTRRAAFIEGYSASAPITDVTIAHCRFLNSQGKSFKTNTERIQLIDTVGLDWE